MDKLKRWILHPFLFAAYPVIALLAHNISQIVPLFAMRSLLFALCLALACLLLLCLVLRDWHAAALVTSTAVLLFFVYGWIFSAIQYTYIFGINIGRHRLLIGFFVLLLAALGWLSRKFDLPAWTRLLNLVSLIALLLPVIQILWYETHSAYLASNLSASSATTAAELGLHVPEGEKPPDIYYIILDMYTRGDAMQANLHYDNSSFLGSLEQKGFYVASCSQSNYPSTYPSLTSSLNMNYLSSLSKDFAPPNTQEGDMFTFLQANAVRSVLKDLGYQIVGFESGFSPDEFHSADHYFASQTDLWSELTMGGLNPFESLLMQESAGVWFYDYSLTHPNVRPFFDYSYITFRNRMVYAMDKLPDIPAIPGPKFVYLHLIAPHNPFAFGPDGEVIVRRTPFTFNNDPDTLYLSDFIIGYTGEVIYLNQRFLAILDQILQRSSPAPIIILQGDHGIPRIKGWNMANLNAYFLPNGGARNLYPSISPVNSFRVIFNTYFGGHLGILQDKACNSSSANPYACPVLVDPDPKCLKP